MTMKTLSNRSGVLSDQAILFAILVGCHASLRFTNIAVQLVPDSAIVTIAAFLVVGAFWAVDLANPQTEQKQRRNRLTKWALVMLAIGLITILPTILMIFWHVTAEAPHSFSHDSLLQSEAAVQFVLDGKNPYIEDYFGTLLELWPIPYSDMSVNPAMFHYTYMPFMFIFPLPFQVLGEALFGWFDHRLLFMTALAVVLLLGQRLIHDPDKQLTWLLIMGLNPIFVPSFIEGRNDILVLFWVVLAIYLLHRDRTIATAIMLGLACTTKQLAWFFVPFFFVYIGGEGTLKQKLKRASTPFLLLCLIFGLVVLPWFIWSPAAFWEDTFSYLGGSTEHSPPMSGFGFSMVLPELGIVDSATDPFSHGLIQMLIGFPVLGILLVRQWRHNQLSVAVIYYAIWVFVVGFFSRRFFDSYLAFVIALATLGALMSPPAREGTAEIQQSPG